MTDDAVELPVRLEVGQTAPDFTLPAVNPDGDENGDLTVRAHCSWEEGATVFLSVGDDTRMHHRGV